MLPIPTKSSPLLYQHLGIVLICVIMLVEFFHSGAWASFSLLSMISLARLSIAAQDQGVPNHSILLCYQMLQFAIASCMLHRIHFSTVSSALLPILSVNALSNSQLSCILTSIPYLISVWLSHLCFHKIRDNESCAKTFRTYVISRHINDLLVCKDKFPSKLNRATFVLQCIEIFFIFLQPGVSTKSTLLQNVDVY